MMPDTIYFEVFSLLLLLLLSINAILELLGVTVEIVVVRAAPQGADGRGFMLARLPSPVD